MRWNRWKLHTGLGLLAAAGLASVAHPADARERRHSAREARSKPGEVGPQKKLRARSLFQEAEKQFRLGRFSRARTLYERAYELLPLPGFLYNIAQCHRLEKNYEKAIFFYKSYLGAHSGAENRDTVLMLIKRSQGKLRRQREREKKRMGEPREQPRRPIIVRARLVPRRQAPPRRPYLPGKGGKPEEEEPLVKRWWFWTSIAGGVVVIVATGLAVGLTRQSAQWEETSLGMLDRR